VTTGETTGENTGETTGPDRRRAGVFRYAGYTIEPGANRLTCHYRLDDLSFTEQITLPGGPGTEAGWSRPGVDAAARLFFLLAGVSYYKAGAPPVIDLGDTALTDGERDFLRSYYLDGLGEYAYRNGLDLGDLRIDGPRLEAPRRAGYVPADPTARRPLIPFGGGVDSIVSVELLRAAGGLDGAALFVVNRPGDRFDAIEDPAVVSGLPVVRAERVIDEKLLRSAELGFLNGHVPVTAIISAIAVLAAVVEGRDAVVMSNEWSASSATLVVAGRQLNHQFSKSAQFESALRRVIADSVGSGVEYFSLLRPFTELWIAREFAARPEYFATFRSCNRAFHIDPARRYDHWCGVCDKCAFIDLILAPYVPRDALARVFESEPGVLEPLENPALPETFRRLLALTPDAKPWECVGDESESRVALRLAEQRPDRAGNPLLATLVAEAKDHQDPDPAGLLEPLGAHHIPAAYLPAALR
jgi:hypothetical protein